MLLICGAILVFAFIVQRVYRRFNCKGISYDITIDKAIVDPDEAFVVTSTVKNDKRLPISCMQLNESFPPPWFSLLQEH